MMMEDTYIFPSHLRYEERFVGPFTGRQFFMLLLGGLVGVSLWHVLPLPPVARAACSLPVPLVLLGGSFVRVGGHGALSWARLAILYAVEAHRFSWLPEAAPPPAEGDESSLAPPLRGRTRGRASAGPPLVRSTTPRTQDLSCVPRSIEDGVVRMPDGHCSAVLACTGRAASILSSDDHGLFADAYWGFLRTLTHPLTIVRRVRTAQTRAYVEKRLARARSLANPTLRRLELYDMAYMEAMAAQKDGPRVTSVSTYIVVPAPERVPPSIRSPFARLFGGDEGRATHDARTTRELEERSSLLIAELARIGVHARRLMTSELCDVWHESLCVRTAEQRAQTGASATRVLVPAAEIRRGAWEAPTFREENK